MPETGSSMPAMGRAWFLMSFTALPKPAGDQNNGLRRSFIFR
jgi:hypothetical protein